MTPVKTTIHPSHPDGSGPQAAQTSTTTEIGFLKSVFAELTGKAPQCRRPCVRSHKSNPPPPSPRRSAGGAGTKLV